MKNKNKVLISNLHEDVMEEDLQEMFEEFGEIESIEISEELDPVLETCSAVVTMAYEEDAEEAIESLHGKRWKGLRLEVDEYEEDHSRSSYDDFDEDNGYNDWSGNSKPAKKSANKRPRGFKNS